MATDESKNGLSDFIWSRSLSGNDMVVVVTVVEEMQWTVWWSLKAADAAVRVGVIWLLLIGSLSSTIKPSETTKSKLIYEDYSNTGS
ncbi:hypothetical protein LWI29_028905 [Acer saccharum]|uniref:Uncharacterized protein n=1 Tax=Acer saccharum TaxID=4024 RepID=A0AA39UWH2_ACESA|nr:hypothetical protein LWI29_028905 [Acer saccharum]